MPTVRGIITHVFEPKKGGNADSFFGIMHYETPTGMTDAKIGVRGIKLELGDYFQADGNWKASTYQGRTEEIFNAKVVRPEIPATVEGATKWFTSIFSADRHGVTPASVKAFLAKHGATAPSQCERKPEMVLGVSTNPAAFRSAILTEWGRRVSGRQVVSLMERCGLEPAVISAVLEALRDGAGATLRANPYAIARIKVTGARTRSIGFRNADKVGSHVGIGPEDSRRVAAALLECLEEVRVEGHTFADLTKLGHRLQDAYGISIPTAARYVVSQVDADDGPIVVSERSGTLVAQLREMYEAEASISENVARMLKGGQRHNAAGVDAVVGKLFEKEEFARFDEVQRAAVALAAREPLCILTGGPGTGKSTVSEVVVKAAESLDTGEILLCAPTGKAAKRLEETTRRKASTIHSLLGAREDKAKGRTVFTRNARNPLPPRSVVLVDEASMLDTLTMRALMEAMPSDGRLILVGDRNQLPSVDAGNVLADMMAARDAAGNPVVPQAELVRVYRQSRDSRIATGAALVREGELPEMSNKYVGGLALFEHEGEEITKRVKWLVETALQKGFKPHHIVVLTPQNPSTAGPGRSTACSRACSIPGDGPSPGCSGPPGRTTSPRSRAWGTGSC